MLIPLKTDTFAKNFHKIKKNDPYYQDNKIQFR